MRDSYSGYYTSLPGWGRQFDSVIALNIVELPYYKNVIRSREVENL